MSKMDKKQFDLIERAEEENASYKGNMIYFEIDGEPIGKGRPKFSRMGNFVRAYTPQKTSDYESKVVYCFHEALEKEGNLWNCQTTKPLRAHIVAYFPLSKADYKTNGDLTSKGLLKEYNFAKPKKKPDADNIAKVILDALNSQCFVDDSQVVELLLNKRYSHRPRVEVTLTELYERENTK